MSDYSWEVSDWESALGISAEVLNDDIQGLDESKALKCHKTEEEIEGFSIDESLTDIERALYVIKNGVSLQKLSLVHSLASMLEEHNRETLAKVMPEFLNRLPDESVTLQAATGRAFHDYLTHQSLPSAWINGTLFPCVQKLAASHDPEVAKVWSDLLLYLIKFLSNEILETVILPEALVNGGLAQPPNFRMWCCRVLGALSQSLSAKTVEKSIMKKATALCQDTDQEVRCVAASQLGSICRGVGLNITKSDILDEFMELLVDESIEVRNAALSSLSSLLEFLDEESKKKIVPCWRRLMANEQSSCISNNVIAKEIGSYLWHLKLHLTEEDLVACFQFVDSLIDCDDVDVKDACVFNLPSLVQVATPARFERLGLRRLLVRVANDKSIQVRRRLAMGLHEIVPILGNRSFEELQDPFLRLLEDQDLVTTLYLARQFRIYLQHFRTEPNANAPPADLLVAYMELEQRCYITASNDWRAHVDILWPLQLLTDFYPTEIIYDQCVPVLLRLLLENVARPVTKAVTRILCHYCRTFDGFENRDRLMKAIFQELKTAGSSRNRIKFFDFSKAVLFLFSKRFYRDNLLNDYLEFAKDPVADVRLHVCYHLPWIKSVVDAGTSPKVDSMVAVLLHDPDQRVRSAASIFNTISLADLKQQNNNNSKHTKQLQFVPVAKTDQEKEREEEKYRAEKSASDEANRRRGVEEARIDWSRRLLESSKAKDKAGNASVRSTKGLFHSSAAAVIQLQQLTNNVKIPSSGKSLQSIASPILSSSRPVPSPISSVPQQPNGNSNSNNSGIPIANKFNSVVSAAMAAAAAANAVAPPVMPLANCASDSMSALPSTPQILSPRRGRSAGLHPLKQKPKIPVGPSSALTGVTVDESMTNIQENLDDEANITTEFHQDGWLSPETIRKLSTAQMQVGLGASSAATEGRRRNTQVPSLQNSSTTLTSPLNTPTNATPVLPQYTASSAALHSSTSMRRIAEMNQNSSNTLSPRLSSATPSSVPRSGVAIPTSSVPSTPKIVSKQLPPLASRK